MRRNSHHLIALFAIIGLTFLNAEPDEYKPRRLQYQTESAVKKSLPDQVQKDLADKANFASQMFNESQLAGLRTIVEGIDRQGGVVNWDNRIRGGYDVGDASPRILGEKASRAQATFQTVTPNDNRASAGFGLLLDGVDLATGAYAPSVPGVGGVIGSAGETYGAFKDYRAMKEVSNLLNISVDELDNNLFQLRDKEVIKRVFLAMKQSPIAYELAKPYLPKNFLDWSKADLSKYAPGYDADERIKKMEARFGKSIEESKKGKLNFEQMNKILSENADIAAKCASLKHAADINHCIDSAAGNSTKGARRVARTTDSHGKTNSLAAEEARALENSPETILNRRLTVLHIADQLVGGTPAARATIKVAEAFAKLDFARFQKKLPIDIKLDMLGIATELLTNLISIFGSQPSIEQIILDEIRALRKQVANLDVKIDRNNRDMNARLDDIQRQIDDRFDRMEELFLKKHTNLVKRLRYAEQVSRDTNEKVSQLGNSVTKQFQALSKELSDYAQSGTGLAASKGNITQQDLTKDSFAAFSSGMDNILRNAVVYSKGPVHSGSSLPENLRQRGNPTEVAKYLGDELIQRSKPNSQKLMAEVLSSPAYEIDLTARGQQGLPWTDAFNNSNKDDYSTINLTGWMPYAESYQKILNQTGLGTEQTPNHGNLARKHYEAAYCLYDPSLSKLDTLIIDGHNQLEQLKRVMPPTSNGNPSLHRLIRVIGQYEKQLSALTDAPIKALDLKDVQKKLDLIKKLQQEKDWLDPEALESSDDKILSNFFTPDEEKVGPCPSFKPQHDGALIPVKDFPLNGKSSFAYQQPPLVKLAQSVLGAEVKMCYDSIEPAESRVEAEMVEENGMASVISRTKGKLGVKLKVTIEYEQGDRKQALTYSAPYLIDNSEEHIFYKHVYRPIYEKEGTYPVSYSHGVHKIDQNDPNFEVWQKAESKNQEHVDLRTGSFKGFYLAQNGISREDNDIVGRAPKVVQDKLEENYELFDGQLLPGKIHETISEKDRLSLQNQLRQSLLNKLNEQVSAELSENISQDLMAKVGPVTEALRTIDGQNILLQRVLQTALGDSYYTDPTLHQLMRSLPSSGTLLSKIANHPEAIVDEKLAKAFLDQEGQPLRLLVSYLTDKVSANLRGRFTEAENILTGLTQTRERLRNSEECRKRIDDVPDLNIDTIKYNSVLEDKRRMDENRQIYNRRLTRQDLDNINYIVREISSGDGPIFSKVYSASSEPSEAAYPLAKPLLNEFNLEDVAMVAELVELMAKKHFEGAPALSRKETFEAVQNLLPWYHFLTKRANGANLSAYDAKEYIAKEIMGKDEASKGNAQRKALDSMFNHLAKAVSHDREGIVGIAADNIKKSLPGIRNAALPIADIFLDSRLKVQSHNLLEATAQNFKIRHELLSDAFKDLKGMETLRKQKQFEAFNNEISEQQKDFKELPKEEALKKAIEANIIQLRSTTAGIENRKAAIEYMNGLNTFISDAVKPGNTPTSILRSVTDDTELMNHVSPYGRTPDHMKKAFDKLQELASSLEAERTYFTDTLGRERTELSSKITGTDVTNLEATKNISIEASTVLNNTTSRWNIYQAKLRIMYVCKDVLAKKAHLARKNRPNERPRLEDAEFKRLMELTDQHLDKSIKGEPSTLFEGP